MIFWKVLISSTAQMHTSRKAQGNKIAHQEGCCANQKIKVYSMQKKGNL